MPNNCKKNIPLNTETEKKKQERRNNKRKIVIKYNNGYFIIIIMLSQNIDRCCLAVAQPCQPSHTRNRNRN